MGRDFQAWSDSYLIGEMLQHPRLGNMTDWHWHGIDSFISWYLLPTWTEPLLEIELL
jgi:hypothetical protein